MSALRRNKSLFGVVLKYTIRNLLRIPVRTLLTLVSITIAISMFVLMNAIGDSFNKQLTSVVQKAGIDIVIQSRYSATPLSSAITQEEVDIIRNNLSVAEVFSLAIGKMRTKEGNVLFVLGVDNFDILTNRLGIVLEKGRTYNREASEAILSARMLRSLHLQVGEWFGDADRTRIKIVGAYSTWMSLFNSSILSSVKNARKIISRPARTNMLFLKLKNAAYTQEFIAHINKHNPNLIAYDAESISTRLGAVKSFFYLSEIFSIIALMAATAILTTTFVMVVKDRMREIGILNTVGWSHGMIVLIFILESVLLTLIGGIFAFILSEITLLYLRSAYINIIFYLPQSLPVGLLIETLLASLCVGIIGAFIPAIFAANKSIVEALKNE